MTNKESNQTNHQELETTISKLDSDSEIKTSEKVSFFKELLNFLKYSSISISSTLLEYLFFFFLVQALDKICEPKIADGISTAICYLAATILCYILNKKFVFKTKNKNKKETSIEALKYFAIALPKMLITSLCVPFVISIFDIQLPILKTLINIIIQTILFFAGYIFQKLWVFKK